MSPISNREIELIVKNLPRKKTTVPESFTGKFYQACSEEIGLYK